jgi:hypothetical protein
MKTFSKISIGLLSLIALSIFSCKKELAPLPVSAKLTSLPSSDYGRVTTIFTGISFPEGIATDAAGNLYVGEEQKGRIVKITPGGIETVIAEGFGRLGSIIIGIKGVAMGPDSNLYVSANLDNTIRKVTLSGVVTIIAGISQISGHIDGPIAQATFYDSFGVAVDAKGNIYVADALNNSVRVVTKCDSVYTLAGHGEGGSKNGPGATATFSGLGGIAVDHHGNVYVSDFNVIRKITPDRTVSTFAGSGAIGSANGVGTAASFHYPYGLVFDSADNLYVADHGGNLIRKITPDGTVSTLAGSGAEGSADGIGASATFNSPAYLAVDRSDNLYVDDEGNGSIRKIVTK